MKKKYYFVIVYTIFIVVLFISISKIIEPNELGEIHSHVYDAIDYNMDIIETNMNEITVSNDEFDWAQLKEINIEDEKLKNTYNLLVSDIRVCYLQSNDLEHETYNNTNILSFRNKTSVSDEELIELRENNNCLENFDKYNSMVLSNDEQLSEKVKKQISIIIDYEPETSTSDDFALLLYEESEKISKIASLTNWLKMEYYSYKD